jgi:hypothetical protein
MEKCSHCRTELPAVVDAFCPFCRSPLCPEPPTPIGPPPSSSSRVELTTPARIVLIVSLLGALGGTVLYLGWIGPLLPGSSCTTSIVTDQLAFFATSRRFRNMPFAL